jgi:hypothetical protein
MRNRDMEDAQGFYNHEEEIGVFIPTWVMLILSLMGEETGGEL